MMPPIAKIPAPPEPARASPKPPPQAAAPAPQRRHADPPQATTALSSAALSRTDVSYVNSLMGAIPAQRMEEILLKTGVPIPANLGPNVDTTA